MAMQTSPRCGKTFMRRLLPSCLPSSSSDLTHPTILRNMRRLNASNFSVPLFVTGADAKPKRTVGVMVASNKFTHNCKDMCWLNKVYACWQNFPRQTLCLWATSMWPRLCKLLVKTFRKFSWRHHQPKFPRKHRPLESRSGFVMRMLSGCLFFSVFKVNPMCASSLIKNSVNHFIKKITSSAYRMLVSHLNPLTSKPCVCNRCFHLPISNLQATVGKQWAHDVALSHPMLNSKPLATLDPTSLFSIKFCN